MVIFGTLSPYSHDILDAVKKWDNPPSTAPSWFDDGMGRIQEAVGVNRVLEINGNELKLY